MRLKNYVAVRQTVLEPGKPALRAHLKSGQRSVRLEGSHSPLRGRSAMAIVDHDNVTKHGNSPAMPLATHQFADHSAAAKQLELLCAGNDKRFRPAFKGKSEHSGHSAQGFNTPLLRATRGPDQNGKSDYSYHDADDDRLFHNLHIV